MAATEEPVVEVPAVEEPVMKDNQPAFEEPVMESATDQNREVGTTLFCGAGQVFGAVSGAVHHGVDVALPIFKQAGEQAVKIASPLVSEAVSGDHVRFPEESKEGNGDVMDLPPPQKRLRSASPLPPRPFALSLECRLNANTAARLKYPDNPEKFAESELQLHEELQKLKILAGAPELYPDLVSLSTVNSLTGLLNHDNTDIAIDAITLLQDLTDADVVADNDESAQVLVDALVENNAVELLVQNLSRLSDSDPDESAAIYNTLSTIENLVEVKLSVSELVCEKTKLLKWLQARIKIREFDSNKQYASEIPAILLQNSLANQKRFGQMNGVDTLFQTVAMYKSKDPKMGDEEEMVENNVLHKFLCLPIMHGEDFVCLGFCFGERYKVAYMSDVSRFLPSTENYISNDGGMEQWLAHGSSAKSTHPLHILLLLRGYMLLCFALYFPYLHLVDKVFPMGWGDDTVLIPIIQNSPTLENIKPIRKRSQPAKFKDFISY